MGVKETQATKMNGSASTAEKLSATFNDIKFHVASAQFAPGLTAGINGTFFGPSSFKGFQFGVTGNFIFGDNFSILTELEYFRRMNNNYSITDNYYTYTQAGGGLYTKTTQPVTYSFSTLQSIEMPISIRYCKSHFNFYVGGNIVYTFAINTGESSSTATSTTVSTAGSNSEGQIKVSDFDSRFGLGYLFGVSYQVTPNMMLDFRNVQTVWDNASTPGAKTISNQLYKSPSLQISIGYRLGGNKDRGKSE
jgi:opacity protein-like surface antigen